MPHIILFFSTNTDNNIDLINYFVALCTTFELINTC